MYLADWVLRAVDAEIGGHPPERGGALLGPRQRPVLTHFVPDPEAVVSSTSYAPSRQLGARVNELERGAELELKGIVHSHQGGLDHPSEQDALELAAGLRHNPHLASYAGPIVSEAPRARRAAHELPLRAGKLSFFAAHRTRDGGAEIRPVRVQLVPLLRDLERAADDLGGEPPEAFLSDAGQGAVLSGRLRLPGGLELLLLASEHYPALPPVLLLSEDAGATEQLQVPWALAAPEEDRLLAALRTVVDGSAAPTGAATDPAAAPRSRRPGRARLAGWEPRLSGDDLEARAVAHRAALLSRGAGLLSDALREPVGPGGGVRLGRLLRRRAAGAERGGPARAGRPGAGRGGEPLTYRLHGGGRRGAPRRRRWRAGCSRSIRRWSSRSSRAPLEALEPAALDALVRGADLVLAATDDPGGAARARPLRLRAREAGPVRRPLRGRARAARSS